MSDRWTYQVIQVKPGTWGGFKSETMETELNRMGALGWEMVSVVIPAPASPLVMVFKRQQ
jgi:hypothetical protein